MDEAEASTDPLCKTKTVGCAILSDPGELNPTSLRIEARAIEHAASIVEFDWSRAVADRKKLDEKAGASLSRLIPCSPS